MAPRGCPAEMGWNEAVAVPSNQPIPASVGCAVSGNVKMTPQQHLKIDPLG
ncbi:hypothetical protein [Acinetobacter baumannii]|uniref:hypothetical protein n=1 Tax=Acinetobacter baumannii TaxID=470 RepID=UPI00143AE18B|nr:hypothetical protein [Acinetobacter baumannii]